MRLSLTLLFVTLALCLLIGGTPALGARRRLLQQELDSSSSVDLTTADPATTTADVAPTDAVSVDDGSVDATAGPKIPIPSPIYDNKNCPKINCEKDCPKKECLKGEECPRRDDKKNKCECAECPRTIEVSAIGVAKVKTDRVHVSVQIYKKSYAPGYDVASTDDSAEPLVMSLSAAARSLRSKSAGSDALNSAIKTAQVSVSQWLTSSAGDASAASVDPSATAAPTADSNDTRVFPTSVEVQSAMSRVQSDMTSASNRLMSYLNGFSTAVSEIESGGIMMNPRYDYGCKDKYGNYDYTRCDYSKPIVSGYDGYCTIEFDVLMAQSSAVIQGAMTAGATSIDSITYKAGEWEIEKASQEAIEKATQLAIGRAEAGARAVSELNKHKKDDYKKDDSYKVAGDVASTTSDDVTDAGYIPPTPKKEDPKVVGDKKKEKKKDNFKLEFCKLKCEKVEEPSYYPKFYSSSDSAGVASASVPSTDEIAAAGWSYSKIKVKFECKLTVKVKKEHKKDGKDEYEEYDY